MSKGHLKFRWPTEVIQLKEQPLSGFA